MLTWKKIAAIVTLLALVAAACGDDDNGGGQGASTGPNEFAAEQPAENDAVEDEPADDAATGEEPADQEPADEEPANAAGEPAAPATFPEPNTATGDAVKLGFATDGRSETVDTSAELPAAQAAVAYANEYLGGLGGRPIELVACETKQTPAGAQDCVAQFASEGVVAILSGLSGQGDTLLVEAEAAGIPLISADALSEALYLSDYSFVLSNGLASLLGPAAIAADNGLTKATILVIDLPAATDGLDAIVSLFYGNVGLETDIVKVAPGTPDMTPQVQAAISGGTEAFIVFGEAGFCISAIQAIQTLGFDGETVVLTLCAEEDVAAEVDLTGLTMVTDAPRSDSDPEVVLFFDVMATYDEQNNPTDSSAEAGYGTVVAFARAMVDHPDGEVTPQSIIDTLIAMEPAQGPLVEDGAFFQCNRQQVAIFPALCNDGAAVTTLDADGKHTGFSAVDLTPVLTFG